MGDGTMMLDQHSIGQLRELVVELQEAAEKVAGQAEALMASAGVKPGADVTLFYHKYNPEAKGQQWIGGKLIACIGSWVILERHDNEQITWRNLALIETLAPGLPKPVTVGVCQKCSAKFPQASRLEVYCPNCSGGTGAAGEA